MGSLMVNDRQVDKPQQPDSITSGSQEAEHIHLCHVSRTLQQRIHQTAASPNVGQGLRSPFVGKPPPAACEKSKQLLWLGPQHTNSTQRMGWATGDDHFEGVLWHQ